MSIDFKKRLFSKGVEGHENLAATRPWIISIRPPYLKQKGFRT